MYTNIQKVRAPHLVTW